MFHSMRLDPVEQMREEVMVSFPNYSSKRKNWTKFTSGSQAALPQAKKKRKGKGTKRCTLPISIIIGRHVAVIVRFPFRMHLFGSLTMLTLLYFYFLFIALVCVLYKKKHNLTGLNACRVHYCTSSRDYCPISYFCSQVPLPGYGLNPRYFLVH